MIIKQSKQKYLSKNTSINSSKIPQIFKLIDFTPNSINLDYGGGKFDIATQYLESIGVKNLIYDPYNRDNEHNKNVITNVMSCGGADTITLSNVLNVIKEQSIRHEVLINAKQLIKPNGIVYIVVYEGDKSGVGKETQHGNSYQLNKKTKDYLDEIKNVFSYVDRKGKLIIAYNQINSN